MIRPMACSAPVVTMISSGSVGSPLAQYLSAMASRRGATPTSSMPMSCRYGVTCSAASTNARDTAAAGAARVAAARLAAAVPANLAMRSGDGASGRRGNGQRGRAPRPLAPLEIAVVAHLGVRRGDRGPRHPQGVGERPLAGQLRADRQATVDDQHAQTVGQPLVGGAAARWTCASCPVRGPRRSTSSLRPASSTLIEASLPQLDIDGKASCRRISSHGTTLDLTDDAQST